VALGLEYVYFIPQQGFGIKWGIQELMRLAKSADGPAAHAQGQGISDPQIPAWELAATSCF
jgi:hypothetical protein